MQPPIGKIHGITNVLNTTEHRILVNDQPLHQLRAIDHLIFQLPANITGFGKNPNLLAGAIQRDQAIQCFFKITVKPGEIFTLNDNQKPVGLIRNLRVLWRPTIQKLRPLRYIFGLKTHPHLGSLRAIIASS